MARFAPRGLLAFVAICAGCGGGPEGPATAEVSGLVSLNGAPVANADVFFHPANPDGPGKACQAVTGEDGRFTVKTHVEAGEYKPGMIPGDYRVTISKLDTSSVTSTLTPPKNVLPPMYALPQTSGFTVTVSASEENDFEFPLQDKGQP
jgi:hypothetical protein